MSFQQNSLSSSSRFNTVANEVLRTGTPQYNQVLYLLLTNKITL